MGENFDIQFGKLVCKIVFPMHGLVLLCRMMGYFSAIITLGFKVLQQITLSSAANTERSSNEDRLLPFWFIIVQFSL